MVSDGISRRVLLERILASRTNWSLDRRCTGLTLSMTIARDACQYANAVVAPNIQNPDKLHTPNSCEPSSTLGPVSGPPTQPQTWNLRPGILAAWGQCRRKKAQKRNASILQKGILKSESRAVRFLTLYPQAPFSLSRLLNLITL